MGFSPALTNINLSIPRGSLTMIVGQVGSGKTSILKTLLDEMHIKQGTVSVSGRIAYLPQKSFLLNDLFRNNITFGNKFDSDKYWKIVTACELLPDINSLNAGEFTEIGENGINLSGGQKQRISIARALYLDADVFLIDDAFSALDPHVGKKIFENVVLKQLIKSGKTVVMTTHVLNFLDQADKIVYMDRGEILSQGNYEEVSDGSPGFREFISQQQEKDVKKEKEKKSKFNFDPSVFEEFYSAAQSVNDHNLSFGNFLGSVEYEKPKVSKNSTFLNKTLQIKGKLTKKERKEIGHVKHNVFLKYFTSGGTFFFIAIITIFVLTNVTTIFSDYWISVWTSNRFNLEDSTYIKIYGGILGFMLFINTAKGLLFGWYIVRVGLNLFNYLISNIIKKPMNFFDTTPIGQLLNLTGKDSDYVDTFLGSFTGSTIGGNIRLIGILIMVGFANYLLIPAILGKIFVYIN